MQFSGLCFCCLWVALLAALELEVQQAPAESTSCMKPTGKQNLCTEKTRQFQCISYLLLFPRPTSAPALRLRSRLGGARLRRRLFGPTVTHAWVCPPASGSWASNPRRSCLESFEEKRARECHFFSFKTKSHFISKATKGMNASRCLTRY